MKGFVQQEGEYSEPFKIPSEGGRGRALAVSIFGLFFLFGDAKTALRISQGRNLSLRKI